MSVTSVEKDPEALTMTVTADLDATVERAWQLWADPRQFEQWWGPPGYPTTVVDHDLRAGGRIAFYMGATEGERHDSTAARDAARAIELSVDHAFGKLNLRSYDIGGRHGTREIGATVAELISTGKADPQ